MNTPATAERAALTNDWYPPDPDGARHCTRAGCMVRARRAFSQWQEEKRKPRNWTHAALIPDCTGTPHATSTGRAR